MAFLISFPQVDLNCSSFFYNFVAITTRVFSQTDKTHNVVKGVINCINVQRRICDVPSLNTLYDTCKVVHNCMSARSFIGKINELISGAASKPSIEIAENVFIPNVLNLASKTSLLLSDLCSTAKWLDSVEIANLERISVSTATVDYYKNSFGAVGTLADLALVCFNISKDGFSIKSWLKIGNDVAKLAFCACINSKDSRLLTIAYVASLTSTVCSFVRFIVT